MTPEQLREVAQRAHKLPEDYRHAIVRPKDLIRLPRNLFQTVDQPGFYAEHDRQVGRYLFREDKAQLKAILGYDLMALRERPHITAHALRVFCYKKFGMQNRKALPLVESDQMATFYKKQRPQELQVQRRSKQKEKNPKAKDEDEKDEEDKENEQDTNMLIVLNPTKQQISPNEEKCVRQGDTRDDRDKNLKERGTAAPQESQEESPQQKVRKKMVDSDKQEEENMQVETELIDTKVNTTPIQPDQPQIQNAQLKN